MTAYEAAERRRGEQRDQAIQTGQRLAICVRPGGCVCEPFGPGNCRWWVLQQVTVDPRITLALAILQRATATTERDAIDRALLALRGEDTP